MPKGIPKKVKVLTDKERMFVQCLTDMKSDTFFNPVKSLDTVGYNPGRNRTETACKILIRPHIIQALKKANTELFHDQRVQVEYSRQWLWNELLELLQACKEAKDRTNWGSTLYKMGEIHAAWVQKLIIQPERAQELSETTKKEALELARLRLLQQSSPIESEFEQTQNNTVSRETISLDTQPVVGTEAIISNDLSGPEQEIDKSIDDNQLQQ